MPRGDADFYIFKNNMVGVRSGPPTALVINSFVTRRARAGDLKELQLTAFLQWAGFSCGGQNNDRRGQTTNERKDGKWKARRVYLQI
jgi:hypothetical protein